MKVSLLKASEIPAGQGVTGTVEGRPIAVYNDGARLIVLENICTHRGCQTEWNAFEQTWDCPCHGSRYYADGSVLQGPAPEPLTQLEFVIENDVVRLGWP